MPGAMHEIAVAKVLHDFPAAKRTGLRQALRREFEDDDTDAVFDFSIGIPDAYLIHRELMTVVLFEVEVGHPIDDDKLEKYCNLYWVLSWLDWDLRLISLNGLGKYTAEIAMGEFAVHKAVYEATGTLSASGIRSD